MMRAQAIITGIGLKNGSLIFMWRPLLLANTSQRSKALVKGDTPARRLARAKKVRPKTLASLGAREGYPKDPPRESGERM